MRSVGNLKAREKYEALAPSFYLRPTDSDSPIVRENWIRAKYVRKEFVRVGPPQPLEEEARSGEHPSSFLMPGDLKEGSLDKLNPKNVWQGRWFLLHRRTLSYFKDGTDSYPKGEIDVTQAEIVVPDVPDASRPYTFELRTAKKAYPLAAASAESMFSWLHALRRARYYYTRVAKDGAGAAVPPEINRALSYRSISPNEVRGGELTKQGGHFKSWNRRWCVVADGCLYYFKARPMNDDTPEGGLSLSECAVGDAEPKTGRPHCFSIVSPSRVFFFIADTAADAKEWRECVAREIEKLTPREAVDFRAEEPSGGGGGGAADDDDAKKDE